MSGGVNVRSTLRPPAPSGIPLPRTSLPVSHKTDRHQRISELPRALTPTSRRTPSHTPTQSPLLCPRSSRLPKSSGRDIPTNVGQKPPLVHQPDGQHACQTSSLAYNSPLTQRRVPLPHSKDSLDLGKLTQIQTDFSLDGNCNRNLCTNQNQTWGPTSLRPPLQLSRGEHSTFRVINDAVPGSGEEALKLDPAQSCISDNGNNYQPPTQTIHQDSVTGVSVSGVGDCAAQSDEEMGTPEDPSPASSSSLPLLPPGMPAMPVKCKRSLETQKEPATSETQAPRVNMAAVAPFSFRLAVLIHTQSPSHQL